LPSFTPWKKFCQQNKSSTEQKQMQLCSSNQ
jgi:hypothetical protein